MNRARAILAQINFVEISFQNLSFVIASLQLQGHDDFVDLACERALVGEEEIFHQLLGDGAAALHRAARAQVGKQRAKHRAWRNAVMFIKVTILDGQQRFD